MPLALAQVAESAESYDSATIALFALFIVVLITTAGLLLRDILQPAQPHTSQTGFPDLVQPGPDVAAPSEARFHAQTPSPEHATPDARSAPAWFLSAMDSQTSEAATAIRATVDQLIDAANRGDLRSGFAVYTPELLARHQRMMGVDAGEFERLLRSEPNPPAAQLTITAVRDLAFDPPHRASATVEYAQSGNAAGFTEKISFQRDPQRRMWLIEQIEQVSPDQRSTG